MRPLVYCAVDDRDVAESLGRADYSYYFVLKYFRPLLAGLGELRRFSDAGQLDAECADARAAGEDPVLFSFAPPHETPLGASCPVIPVFAWEFDKIPDEAWGDDPRRDWTWVLRQLPGAITHSRAAVAATRAELGPDFLITDLPAPVWDQYASIPNPEWTGDRRVLRLTGTILDSWALGLRDEPTFEPLAFNPADHELELSDVVFTSSFNPQDGRKNWYDMLTGFVWAFRDEPRATLVLKLIHFDRDLACRRVLLELRKLSPYRCRVVVIHGYLDTDSYHDLLRATTFPVNTSKGEGQCLPLMEFMSAGKPAVAPVHSAMADYIDSDNAFLLRTSPEWTNWPHDPRLLLRCFRQRLNWESLLTAYQEAFDTAVNHPDRYAEMGAAARESLRAHCSMAVINDRFTTALKSMVTVSLPGRDDDEGVHAPCRS